MEEELHNITSSIATSTGCPSASDDPTSPLKILNFVLIMIVSLVGLIGNTLAILTFSRQKRKTSASTFLMSLAVFDMLLILTTNLFSHRYAYKLVFPESWINHFTSGKLTLGILPISYMCQSFSTWTIVAVALDRYIHICHPLKAARWCRISIAKKVILGIVLSSIVYNIPRFFEYYKILEVAMEETDPCTGYFNVPANTLGGSDGYTYSYAFGLYLVTMYIVPLGSLLFFNGNLVKKLKSLKIPGTDRKVVKLKGSDKILPSLVAIVTIFLICQIPDMVLQILWRINSPSGPTFSIVAYDLIIINSSVNFLIYVIAADGFRRSLIKDVLYCLKITVSLSPTTDDDETSTNAALRKKTKPALSVDYTSSHAEASEV